MADKDMTTKKLEDYNDVFADILNTLLFKKQYIDEAFLVSTKSESIYKTDAIPYKEQRRDTLKDYVSELNNARFVLSAFGIENQSEYDRLMPIRIMGYDFGSYNDQIAKKEELHPVITIVLNFSDKPWGKAKSLHDTVKIPEELKEFVEDYKIKVFDIAYLGDDVINSFKSDFRAVAKFFKNKRLGKNAFEDDKALSHATEVLEMLKVFAKDEYYEKVIDRITEYKEMKGEVTMCTAAQMLVNQGMAQGMAQGIEKGIEQGKNVIDGMREVLLAYGLDKDAVEDIVINAQKKLQQSAEKVTD